MLVSEAQKIHSLQFSCHDNRVTSIASISEYMFKEK